MRVGEICNHHVAIIGMHDTLYAAARLMRDYNVADVVVIESRSGINMPLGIVTDRDIVISIIAEGLELDSVSIGDIMNNNLLTANENDDVMATLKRMRYQGVRRVPVTSQNHGLVGILSVDNILDSIAEQLNDIDQIIVGEKLGNEQLSLRLSN